MQRQPDFPLFFFSERWQAHSAGDSSLDIAEEMMRLTTGNFYKEIDIFVSSHPKWQIPRKIWTIRTLLMPGNSSPSWDTNMVRYI